MIDKESLIPAVTEKGPSAMSSHYNTPQHTMSNFKSDQWNGYVQWWPKQYSTTSINTTCLASIL